MKKAILIVSFGTTYPDTRQKNIAAITRQVRALYPDAVRKLSRVRLCVTQ